MALAMAPASSPRMIHPRMPIPVLLLRRVSRTQE
jgi:hypothetical protein